MLRILQYGMSDNPGGIESYLLEQMRALPSGRVQMDFLSFSPKPICYEEELEKLGARVYHVVGQGRIGRRLALFRFFQTHGRHYDVLVLNLAPLLSGVGIFALAWLFGVHVRVAHIHNAFYPNAQTTHRQLFWHRVARFFFAHRLATLRFACSHLAGTTQFGKNVLFSVIPNAFSTEAFAFSAEARVRLRQEFHDEGKLIVGHVGSFYAEKNHAFLLRVFAALRRQREDAVLWLVGDCETERGLGVEMRALAKSLGIASSVRFLGKRKDVSECLSAMDVFIFPSKSEGLGTAFLEAQAAGLLAIGSDRLPEEVQVLDSVRFMSLEASPEEWADRVLQMLAENGQSREQAAASFRVSPYDSAHAVPALIDMYEAFVKQDPKEGR